MNKIIAILFFSLVFPILINAQEDNPVYDSILAKELGADEYGMKSYFLVMLSTGDSIIEDKNIIQEHFAGHLKNIQRLSDEKKLIVAGPLGSNDKGYQGIFIFDFTSREKLVQALHTDPAITAGLLNYTIYDWYGSAALPVYLKTHEEIQKTSF